MSNARLIAELQAVQIGIHLVGLDRLSGVMRPATRSADARPAGTERSGVNQARSALTGMSPMLEKIARAIYEAEPGCSPLSGPQWDWDWMVAEGWVLPDVFRRQARAALLAVREPNDDVLRAATDHDNGCGCPCCCSRPYFGDVIDAILAGETET